MTKYVAIVFQSYNPPQIAPLGKYAYYVVSNSEANAKKKFISEQGKNIQPLRTTRYPVEIRTIGEYISMWSNYHTSFVTEGYQLVSKNGQKSWALSTKNAKNDKDAIKRFALKDINSGNDFTRTVPSRY